MPTEPHAQSELADTGELYVNYLPIPARDRRFLRVVIPALLWGLVVVAFIWARAQQDPGPAVWDDAKARTFEGWLSAHPYPILYAADTGEGTAGPMLLVGVGKQAAPAAVTALDGQFVRLQGWLLKREGRTMIELDTEFQAAKPAISPPSPPKAFPGKVARGQTTLRGEIVDSKCFLGAMKPGDGKAHKACAALCVRGGIPPMLVVKGQSPGAPPKFYLLLGPGNTRFDGDSASSALLPTARAVRDLIGEPVEVSGELNTWGDLNILTLADNGVRRL